MDGQECSPKGGPDSIQRSARKSRRPKEFSSDNHIKVLSWNIQRGIEKHEKELTSMLKKEKIQICFLLETDTKFVTSKNFRIEGYQTIIPKLETSSSKVRIICLVQEEISENILVVDKAMYEDIASIWLSLRCKDRRPLNMCGVYRQWD